MTHPIALSDDQLGMVMHACQPMLTQDRDRFFACADWMRWPANRSRSAMASFIGRSRRCGASIGSHLRSTSSRGADAPLARRSREVTHARPRRRAPPAPLVEGKRASGVVARHCLPDRLEVVGRVEFGAVGAPSAALDDPVDGAELVGRNPQSHDLAEAHHHIPGHYLDPGAGEFLVPAGLFQVLDDLIEGLGSGRAAERSSAGSHCRRRMVAAKNSTSPLTLLRAAAT